jgi:hypothetical protein
MTAWKKLAAPLLATAFAIGATPAYAVLKVGEQDSVANMESKLKAENQVEVVSGTTGGSANLLGVKFYYDKASKQGYIILTDKPDNPSNMKVYAQLSDARLYNASGPENDKQTYFADPRAGALKCQELIAAGKVPSDNCSDLNTVLANRKAENKMVFLQGTKPNGVIMTAVMRVGNQGAVYESSAEGATMFRGLAFTNANYTPEGRQVLQSVVSSASTSTVVAAVKAP